MATLTCPTVQVELPEALADGRKAFVRSWRVGRGSRPTTVQLALPDTPAGATAWSDGLFVAVYHDGNCVFRGHTVAQEVDLSGQSSMVELTAYDVRYRMSYRRIGQYGIGPQPYGWPGYGTQVVFNPRGKGNRSAAPDGVAYTFDQTIAAYQWTYGQILQWLFNWYVDPTVCTFPASYALAAPLAQTAPEITADVGTPLDLCDAIMRQLGGSWQVVHAGTYQGSSASAMVPLLAGIGAANSHTLHLDGDGSVSTPGRLSVGAIRVSRSIANSFDRVEVHTAPAFIETTYHSGVALGSYPLFTLTTSGNELPAKAMAMATVDVTQYANANLGYALAAGSAPKPWRETLATRVQSSGYLTAGSATWVGTPLKCSDCIWLSFDSGATWRKVLSGVKVDLKLMRLYVDFSGTLAGNTAGTTLAWSYNSVPAGLQVAMTVATLTELPVIAGTDSQPPYLAATRCRKIVRRDLQPGRRYRAYLPTLGSANPNDRTLYATSLELYDDPTAIVTAMRDELYRSRQAAEITAQISLPFAPHIELGDSVTLAPYTLGLGTLRVTAVAVNAETYETSLAATNNVDFAT